MNHTNTSETYWNGLPTTALRGTAVVADAPEFPAYWARDLIGQRIPVVLVDLDGVNYGGGIHYLDNRDGSGWAKVTTGHGSPAYGHASVAIEDGSFQADPSDTVPLPRARIFQNIPRPETHTNPDKDRRLPGKQRRRARRAGR